MQKLHRRKRQKSEHILVRIKNELQLSQDEIPEWLGISLATFKNIVHSKVDSWDKHAPKISQATGVTVKSLLANNSRKPLLANDGKHWTAQKYRAGIAARYLQGLVRERSRGRHTLQWFRILMIKIARCMLAAYRDKKSGDAFIKLLHAIREVGKLYPTYTAKIPPKPGDAFMTIGGKTVQIEKCPSEDWDSMLQVAVGTIPSRSRKGVIKIFGSFVNDILAEEKRQIISGENDLILAEKKVVSLTKNAEPKSRHRRQ